MKKYIAIICAMLMVSFSGYCAKTVNGKKIKEVKEYKIDGGKKILDRTAKYDAAGNKTEEIDYKNGAKKSRTVFTYNNDGKCIEEKHYDENNKLEKTVKIEYNESGKKKSEKSFLPNGKLKSEHTFEYVTE